MKVDLSIDFSIDQNLGYKILKEISKRMSMFFWKEKQKKRKWKKQFIQAPINPLTKVHLDMIEKFAKIINQFYVGVLNKSENNSLFYID